MPAGANGTACQLAQQLAAHGAITQQIGIALQQLAQQLGAQSLQGYPGGFGAGQGFAGVGSPFAGASTPDQLAQNLRAVELDLSSDDLAEIDVITGADRYKPTHG